MKAREFIAQHPELAAKMDAAHDRGDCSLCVLHEQFAKIADDELACPKCGAALDRYTFGDGAELAFKVVGSTNVSEPDEHEEIAKYPVGVCDNCKATIALMPTTIAYNGNHDVYYTGGREFLTEPLDLGDRLLEKITNYTERIRAGETLQPWNLDWWLKGEIESAIAEYLVKHGHKAP